MISERPEKDALSLSSLAVLAAASLTETRDCGRYDQLR